MDEINHNILYRPSLGDKKLALLLDPEKADLNALPLSSDSHPDFIFVGGSTGGDTTPFVRALREKLSIVNYQLFSFPAQPLSLPPKQMLSFISLCFPEITRNTLFLSRLNPRGAFMRRLLKSSPRHISLSMAE